MTRVKRPQQNVCLKKKTPSDASEATTTKRVPSKNVRGKAAVNKRAKLKEVVDLTSKDTIAGKHIFVLYYIKLQRKTKIGLLKKQSSKWRTLMLVTKLL